MKKTNFRQELAALQEEAVRDILSKSEPELRKEATEDGEDFDVLASHVRTTIVDAAARAKRQALIDARAKINSSVLELRRERPIPQIAQIKLELKKLEESEPSFAVNFRNGKKQTDNDLISLYIQLIELGKIHSKI